MNRNLTFIGGGNIAQAIIGGLLETGFSRDRITVADPSKAQGSIIEQLGVTWTTDNLKAVGPADLIFLCVKPGLAQPVCEALAGSLNQKCLISVAAGVTTLQLKQWSQSSLVIRCMPNTPALVRSGMLGLFADPSVDPSIREAVVECLTSVGITEWFEREADLDAVTAISGSGPAYFFYLMETMITAAEKMGLSHTTATTLVTQTALGAARMAHQNHQSPGILRQQVTSPGGTTQAACEALSQGGFETLVIEACEAAKVRSETLSGT